MLIVLTTIPDSETGERISKEIVLRKLAACVQILPPIKSIYFWEGKVQSESEHLLLIKTLESKYDALEVFITANHPYDTPEITAIESHRISARYQDWLAGYVT